jgi:hypothetical protein
VTTVRVGFVLTSLAILGGASTIHAQDLAPRAYLISPLRSTAVTLGYTYNTGELLFEGTVPITGATGQLSVPSVSWYQSFSLLGRSANVLAALPYGMGTFEGEMLEQQRSICRSGLFDSVFRVSVNLVGGKAMSLPQMRQWRQKTLVGLSLKVVAPTGQYDPTKLINPGANRQLLARRPHEPRRRREPGDAAAELAPGDHGGLPRDARPVAQAQLRARRLHPVRRRPPGALSRVAVLVDQRSLEAEHGEGIKPFDVPSREACGAGPPWRGQD